jgi:serine/threonine-protein kinase
MTKQTDRRTFLAAAGATAATVALAGCSGGGDDDDDGNGGSGSADVPSEVDTYLSDNNAKNYDGSAVDETGSDSVSVTVGAGSAGLAFGPAAVIVSPGTEVTWEWSGEGGAHNVESTESPTEFRSGEPVNSSSNTFSRTFESAGNYMYQCYPHRGAGMHGAIIVQEE